MDLITSAWRKASRSSDAGDNCVEVASTSNAVALRDSKDPDSGHILVSRKDFRHFAKALKNL